MRSPYYLVFALLLCVLPIILVQYVTILFEEAGKARSHEQHTQSQNISQNIVMAGFP